MKKIIFIPFFLFLLITSCQKEEVLMTPVEAMISNQSIEDVDDILNDIAYEGISMEFGILHFTNSNQLLETVDLLDEANKVYSSIIASQLTLDSNADYVYESFIGHFQGVESLYSTYGDKMEVGGFYEVIPSTLSMLFNIQGEIIISGNYYHYFDNGTFDELLMPTEDQINGSRVRKPQPNNWWGDNCADGAYDKNVLMFNFCGMDYELYYRAGYLNLGADLHIIYGFSRLRKGNPNNVRELNVHINGDMHSNCDVPITIAVPSVYNINLNNNGTVPNFNTCQVCNRVSTRIKYLKPITQMRNIDKMIANFKIRVNDCDQTRTENVKIIISNE